MRWLTININASIRKYIALDKQIDRLGREISEILEIKLGDGWGITQQTDGVCLCNDMVNAPISEIGDLNRLLKLPREEAIEEILKRAI